MRLLNKQEQNFCKQIYKLEPGTNYFGNVVVSFLESVNIIVDKKTQKIKMVFTYNDQNEELLKERIYRTELLLLEAITLIILLKDSGYIMLFKRNQISTSDTTIFGNHIMGQNAVENEIIDEDTISQIINLFDKEIYITKEFEDFCKNNFLTRDEVHRRKEAKYTRWILIFAFITMLSSIFIPLIIQSC